MFKREYKGSDRLTICGQCTGCFFVTTPSEAYHRRLSHHHRVLSFCIMSQADQAAGPPPSVIVAYIAEVHKTFLQVSELVVGDRTRARCASDDGLVYRAAEFEELMRALEQDHEDLVRSPSPMDVLPEHSLLCYPSSVFTSGGAISFWNAMMGHYRNRIDTTCELQFSTHGIPGKKATLVTCSSFAVHREQAQVGIDEAALAVRVAVNELKEKRQAGAKIQKDLEKLNSDIADAVRELGIGGGC